MTLPGPSPDTYFIILFNLFGYIFLWVRSVRKEAVKDYQHGKMWNDYERRHGLNGYSKDAKKEGVT